MSTRHTPGWEYLSERHLVISRGRNAVDPDMVIADVRWHGQPHEANGKLLAAAPELADAAASAIMRLADFSRYFRNHGDRVLAEILEEVLEAHRAALHKAGRLP